MQARGSRPATCLQAPLKAESVGVSHGAWAQRDRCLAAWRRSFEDQAGEIERQRKSIADQHGFGGVGQAEGGRTFDVSASLGGIAALGIGLPADTQPPGIGTDLHVARQADGTIGQGEVVVREKPRGCAGWQRGRWCGRVRQLRRGCRDRVDGRI